MCDGGDGPCKAPSQSTPPAIDWEQLLWETRGALFLDDDEPVPKSELKETAHVNGWREAEFHEAWRAADCLEGVGDELDDPHVVLADEADESTGEDTASPPVNPWGEEDETGSSSGEGQGKAANQESAEDDDPEQVSAMTATVESWHDADFTIPESGVWAPARVRREQWMGHVEKRPFAPWADANARVDCEKHDEPTTCDECEHDARYKWGYEGNYTDGETVAMAADDPRLDGRVFLQQEADPFAFVDGDDVRDPETGEVHPDFLDVLDRLGHTYADVSTSGSGVHANYRGGLPEGLKQATFQLDDEPWGANEDAPTVEIYDGKHVCVATGEHVPGTGTAIEAWDAGALEAVLEEHDELPEEPTRERPDRADYELDGYEPTATASDETTDEIRDVFAALDRLDAERVAAETIVHAWNDHASTASGNRAFYPTWGPDSNGTATYVDTDQGIYVDTGDVGGYGGPVVMALIDAGEVQPSNATPRISGETWWRGVEHLRECGYSIPEYQPSDDDTDAYAPGDAVGEDYTLDPAEAWHAASAVGPDDLADALPLEGTADGEAWTCPDCGERVDDVARAGALATGTIQRCEAPLTDEYHDAYHRAREEFGAPLPEYVSASDATDDIETAYAAVHALRGWHILDALDSEVVDDAPAGDDARAVLDPTWEDSESGERVVLFDSGLFYCREHMEAIDPIRVVALEKGLIDHETAALEGDTFLTAYKAAREEYGARLPAITWNDAETDGAPEHVPMLPPAEELLGELATDADGLDAARQEVEQLYRDLATEPGADLLTALPALGKTTSVVKTARDKPTFYGAPRKELMQEVAEKAATYGVSYMHLPILSETRPETAAIMEAAELVREEGKGVLREPEQLVDELDADPYPDDKDDDTPGHAHDDPGCGDDDVDLDRATCTTAEGAHDPALALAVHVARELGHSPREIHVHDTGLFGQALPCEPDCPYSQAWERASDPDAPTDLLIGHYMHAHVPSVRSYAIRGRNDRIEMEPRAIALDEFIGDTYGEEFGEEFLHHARWLASALSADVSDATDLIDYREALWTDPWVRRWLAGKADPPTLSHVRGMQHATDAVAAAEELLEQEELDDELRAALTAVKACAPAWAAADIAAAYSGLCDVLDDVYNDDPALAETVADRVGEPLEDTVTEHPGEGDAPLATVPDDAWVSGDLRTLVERAVETFRADPAAAVEVLDAVSDALIGGEDGVERLAANADDGYAHPEAYWLLLGVLAPVDGESDDPPADVPTVSVESGVTEYSGFVPGREHGDGTRVKRVNLGRVTVLLDRNQKGALVHKPPEFGTGRGANPVIGLDASGRPDLWELALGREVTRRDIHDTTAERQAFLRETLPIQVIQTSPHVNTYDGDPAGKNFEGDVALVERVAEEFGRQQRLRSDTLSATTNPGVITTKKVETALGERLAPHTSAVDHYWNVAGSNEMAECNVGVLLGSTHPGDAVIEKWAALAGEAVERDGHGVDLDYGSDVANTFLKHVREDQVFQAALRFGRDEEGAVVFAHTAALREDLPVVGEGATVRAFSESHAAVARAMRDTSAEFTKGDVLADDRVTVGERQVRRILDEFATLGYVEKHHPGPGLANEYEYVDDPGSGHVELPAVGGDEGDMAADTDGGPGRSPYEETHTRYVRVGRLREGEPGRMTALPPTLPAPDEVSGPLSPG